MNTLRGPSAALSIRFFLFGLGALVLQACWLLVHPGLVVGHHYRPETVEVVHLLILGFLLPVVMGSAYMIVPVALGVPLASERVARWQSWMHFAGVLWIVPSFVRWDMAGVGSAGGLIFLGVLLFVWNLGCTLGRVPRPDAASAFIATTLLWLLFTLTFGLVATANKSLGFLPGSPTSWMYAHAHLGVIGVFLNLTIGVSLRLVPMFALTEVRSRARVWIAFLLINLGAAWLAGAIAFDAGPFRLACGVAVASGLLLALFEVEAMLRVRRRRHLDWGLVQFRVALWLLVPTIGLGLFLAWDGAESMAGESMVRVQTAYPLLGLMGVATLAVLGMLHKILPFLVWYKAYSPLVGRAPVPALADMTDARLQGVGFWLHLAGVAGMLVGVMQGRVGVAFAGAALWAGAVGVFVWNAVKVLGHWRPRVSGGVGGGAR